MRGGWQRPRRRAGSGRGALATALAGVCLCAFALLPGRAEAGYEYVGQWAVPTEAEAIAVGPDGIYVSNGQSAKTPAKVTRYSPRGRLTATWGGIGDPGGLSVGPDGRVWVVDGFGTIRVFAPNGGQVDRQTLSDSCGFGGEVVINDLEVGASGDLYQTVYDNCDLGGAGSRRDVVRTTFPGWRVAAAWGGLDGSANDGEFGSSPLWVASGGRGKVYVSDPGNERIQQFTPTGGFVREWGQLGGRPGQFNGLGGIAVGPSGEVFAADRNNERVQRFSPNGRFIEELTTPSDVRYKGLPADLDVDAAGRVYLLTTNFATEDEVQVFAPAGGSGGSVRLPKQKLRYRNGGIKVKLACPDAGACRGKLRILAGGARLAKGRYALAAGERGRAIAKPTKLGRVRLGRTRSVEVTVELQPQGGGKVTKRLMLRS